MNRLTPPETAALVDGVRGKAEPLEFRPDHNGAFDEIVARFADGMVHVETMSGTSCYVGFYWDDGRYCQWWISSNRKLGYHHEDGMGNPPRFTAQGIDRGPEDQSLFAQTGDDIHAEPDWSPYDDHRPLTDAEMAEVDAFIFTERAIASCDGSA